MTTIAVILGSTRPGRKGEAVAHWVLERAGERTDARFELLDLAQHRLPDIDEPVPPARGHYTHDHTRAWAATVARYDGYVFVTPEYNHSLPGPLKNALDRVYAEWNNKAAALVSYGWNGGVRAAEQLRLVMGSLQVADVTAQVALNLATDFRDLTDFAPAAYQDAALTTLLDQVVAWSAALAPLRTAT
ncbi:NADPH-dependent FMN reductase [Dactylosporangium siamense]|uniref:FMN reductase n=1 Tax=Dactylosporangium siamense TaxID=685454 RepID=A0A919PP83_9ACTN|nr:NAD(P)H-dependent oxidoreductase [Dactylosporangium siamense]GIG46821.1 FMN reductase [Dactylosporangium siamense]